MQFEVGQFGAEEPVELYKSEFLMSTRVWEKKMHMGTLSSSEHPKHFVLCSSIVCFN